MRNIYRFNKLSPEAQLTAITKLQTVNLSSRFRHQLFLDLEKLGLHIQDYDPKTRNLSIKPAESILTAAAGLEGHTSVGADINGTATQFLEDYDELVETFLEQVKTYVLSLLDEQKSETDAIDAAAVAAAAAVTVTSTKRSVIMTTIKTMDYWFTKNGIPIKGVE